MLWGQILGQEKTTIAVLDLAALNVTPSEAAAITARVQYELVQTNKYTVLERAQVSEILKEQGFQQAVCTTTECYIQAGKMLGVQKIVGGSVSKVGDLYSINLKFIDVVTGTIDASSMADLKGGIEQVALELAKSAVEQLVFGVKPKKSKTWLYVGGAGLVVGGAVAVYLLTQEEEKANTGNLYIQIPENP
jgi:hypothetical protein